MKNEVLLEANEAAFTNVASCFAAEALSLIAANTPVRILCGGLCRSSSEKQD